MASLPFLGELRLEDIAPKGDDHQDAPDPTAAPPGYNEERALADDRNRELKKTYEWWKAGKTEKGDLKEDRKIPPFLVWKEKWYSKDTILEHTYPFHRNHTFSGYFDWDKTFFLDWKLVGEQEAFFKKATLLQNDEDTGMETFMHPASSVFETIRNSVSAEMYAELLREGAWIIDGSNLFRPTRKNRSLWQRMRTQCTEKGQQGFVICTVQPASLSQQFFGAMHKTGNITRPRTGGHKRFSDAAKEQVGGSGEWEVTQQDFDDAWVFDEFDGVVENPLPTEEEQKQGASVEQYERLRRLLQPFAKSDDRIFLVVPQTWDDHGKGPASKYADKGKQCAFYNPDEHTNPQLQERGRDGLAWPRNLSAEERLDPEALFKNDQKSFRYRNRYTAIRKNDGRAADYESQTTKVRELNESRTKEDHRYCEFDDVLSVMMRVWLMRNADPQPCVPGVIPEDRTEQQPPVQQAPPRRSLAEREREQSQRDRGYQRRQPPSWGSSSSRGDASMNWRRGTGDTSLPFDYLPDMSSYLAVPTNKELKQLFDDLPHRNGRDDFVGTANQRQGIMTNDKQMRSVVEDHRLADAHNEYFKYNDLFRLRVYQLVTRKEYSQRKTEEERRSNEIIKFARKYLQDDFEGLTYEKMQYLNYHERVELEEKFQKEAIKEGRPKIWSRQKSFIENLWKTNQTISPSGIKNLQNDRISQPISMYGGELPKVEYNSPEARDYMHHTCNTFAVDLSRWYRRVEAEVTNHASHQRARYDAQYQEYLQNPEAYPQMEMFQTLKLWWREVQKVQMRLEALQRAPK